MEEIMPTTVTKGVRVGGCRPRVVAMALPIDHFRLIWEEKGEERLGLVGTPGWVEEHGVGKQAKVHLSMG